MYKICQCLVFNHLSNAMDSLLIFIPETFKNENPGFIFGRVVYDAIDSVTKVYAICVREAETEILCKSNLFLIGYYCSTNNIVKFSGKKCNDWVNVYLSKNGFTNDYDYHVKDIVIGGRSGFITGNRIVIITYDKQTLEETELFPTTSSKVNHFYDLMKILQNKQVKDEIREKSRLTRIKETFLTYQMLLYFYPICFLSKALNKLMPIFKYSYLGLHILGWLENMKWMLISVIQNKRFTLKAGNYVSATVLDILLGRFMLKLLLSNIEDIAPSNILLNYAEEVVDALKDLMTWLMGAPAGMKLNYSFNTMLGSFFLYHIELWWIFLLFIQPLMDFAFKVLFLFGRLGITFQISIAADLLALVSFHSYCIYVYATRLFNIQLQGLIALSRLFLGKKLNPLRQRVDTCEYQSDQLFIGTLLFTILLFLMPTTWVYYTVFTLFRLILIGFGGFLTRLKFYLQIIPLYACLEWLLKSHSVKNTIDLSLNPDQTEEAVTLSMTMVASSWSRIWKKSIPDTISKPPPVRWKKIINDVIWGQLLYCL